MRDVYIIGSHMTKFGKYLDKGFKEFSSETGHKAILSFGSTGKLYAQLFTVLHFMFFYLPTVSGLNLQLIIIWRLPDRALHMP